MELDLAGSGLYRIGGTSLLIFVGLTLIGGIAFGVGRYGATSGATGEQALTYIAGHKRLLHFTNMIFHLGPLLLIPAALALYTALSVTNRSLMLIATGVATTAIPIFLGWIFALNVALARLSDRFVAANEVQQAAYAAAADLNLGMQAGGEILGAVLFAIWISLTGFVMLHSAFSRVVGYLGVTTGLLALVGQAGASATGSATLGALGLLSVILQLVWFLTVGVSLLRL